MQKLEKYRWYLAALFIIVIVLSGLISVLVDFESRDTAFVIRDVVVVALLVASLAGFVAHQKHMVE
jgi:hypothetical protein